MSTDPGARLLVVRFGAMGDLIQLSSLLQTLHRTWERPVDVLGAHGWPGRVLRGLPGLGETASLTSRRTPYWLSPPQRAAVGWLRQRGPGPTWLFEPKERPAAKSAWLLARGGIPADLVVDARELPRGLLEHTVDYLHRLAVRRPAAAPDPPHPPPDEPPLPALRVTADELADCRRWLAGRGWRGEPLVALQSQSRRANRGRWPDHRWAAAARGVLAELPEARLLLAGTPAEEPEVDRLADLCADPRVEPAAADLPLRRLFALLSLAHSCISLDSGPAHAAAAVGCPVAVLQGMADPRRCAPRGAPGAVRVVAALPESEWPDDPHAWHRLHRMEEIGVDAVLEAWRAAWRSRPETGGTERDEPRGSASEGADPASGETESGGSEGEAATGDAGTSA